MEAIAGIRRRIAVAQDLLSVVKTMKALAAANVHQSQHALAALRHYAATVELGWQAVLRKHPEAISRLSPPGRGLLWVIVFGSDQGMCGGFNRETAQQLSRELGARGMSRAEYRIVAVGARVASELEGLLGPLADTLPAPSSVEGITRQVQSMIVRAERWQTTGDARRIELHYQRPAVGPATFSPQVSTLLPIDTAWATELRQRPWSRRALPDFTIDWRELLVALVRQHMFESLYRAYADSLTSENAHRLASMQAAERKTEERLEELHRAYHRQRQSEITEELLDVISGFEALKQR